MDFRPPPFESRDWLETIFPSNNFTSPLEMSQPVHDTYMNNFGIPFERGFHGIPITPAPIEHGICNSFDNNQHEFHGRVGRGCSMADVQTQEIAFPSPIETPHQRQHRNPSFSSEAEDEITHPLTPPSPKKAPQTPPSTPKSSYRPAWSTSHENPSSVSSNSSPLPTKRQKRIKLPSSVPSDTPRRKSQRKSTFSTTHHHRSQYSPSTSNSDFDSPTPRPVSSKTKKSHNLTEKKYRNRLNGYFDNLLSAIPRTFEGADGEQIRVDMSEKKICKGEVLILALEHIKALERERRGLRVEVERLSGLWKE